MTGAGAMTGIAPVLGVLAVLVGIADTIPYVRDTLRGATRPHRGTWLIWSVLAILVCLSQRADGASWSLLMAAAQAVLISFVFVLAIGRGEGGVSAGDRILIAIAGGGVAGWMIAEEPVVATVCVVVADLIGGDDDAPEDLPRSRLGDARDLRPGGSRRGAGRRSRRRARRLAAALPDLLRAGQRRVGDPHPPPATSPAL